MHTQKVQAYRLPPPVYKPLFYEVCFLIFMLLFTNLPDVLNVPCRRWTYMIHKSSPIIQFISAHKNTSIHPFKFIFIRVCEFILITITIYYITCNFITGLGCITVIIIKMHICIAMVSIQRHKAFSPSWKSPSWFY